LSWRVVGDDPGILVLVFAGLVGYVVLSVGLFLALFGRLPHAHDFVFPHYLVALPVLWFGSIASSYCNFAVTAIADLRLRGETATVRDGIRVANRHFGRIVAWTVLSGAVGLVLQVIADRFKLGGLVARWIFGVAWGLATVFVVPVMVIEGTPVGTSIRRSARTFKSRWGETVAADAGVATSLLVAVVPLLVLCAILAAVSVAAAITAAAIVVATFITVSGALSAVVNVALYRYATEGLALGGFTANELDRRFKRKQPRGSRRR